MLKLTWDTNCFIAIDEGREPAAGCLRALLDLHSAGTVQVRLSAVGASENQPASQPPLADFGQFRARLAAIGLGGIELLKPPVIWGFDYWGESVWCGPDCQQLARDIHAAMFQTRPFHLEDRLQLSASDVDRERAQREWRRNMCDVLTVWCHIHSGGDILVTSDKHDMLSNRDKLIALGAKAILSPCEAVVRTRQ